MTTEAFSHRDIYPREDYSTLPSRLKATIGKLQEVAANPNASIPPKTIESRGFLGSLALLISEKTSQKVMDRQKTNVAEAARTKEQTPRGFIGLMGSIAILSTIGSGALAAKAEQWVAKRIARYAKQHSVFKTGEPVDTTLPAPPDYQPKHAERVGYIGKRRRLLFMQPGEKVEPVRSHRAPAGRKPQPEPIPAEEPPLSLTIPEKPNAPPSPTPLNEMPTIVIPRQREAWHDQATQPHPKIPQPRESDEDKTQELPKVAA